jgi:RNA polymerase sigma factor (sigma-70 family)
MQKIEEDFQHLIQEVRNGSEEAAWQLVEQFGESIRRAVRRALNDKLRPRFDSVDFVQVVWTSLFRLRDKLDRFDRPEALAAYLVTMARNKVGMEVRRQMQAAKRNVVREQSLDALGARADGELFSRQPSPVDVAIARERWDAILQDQPAHYRQIIQLRLQGHTCQGIADIMHLDECTVRRFLKKLLHATDE